MASKSLGTLTIDLIAKIAGFEQGMDKDERERRQHHPKNNAPRQLAAENAHGQIGGEKDKGKGKRAPSGVKAE